MYVVIQFIACNTQFCILFQTKDLQKLYEVKGHKSEIDDLDINPSGNKVILTHKVPPIICSRRQF